MANKAKNIHYQALYRKIYKPLSWRLTALGTMDKNVGLYVNNMRWNTVSTTY